MIDGVQNDRPEPAGPPAPAPAAPELAELSEAAADGILRTLRPATALVVGGQGGLVAALRARGVDTIGLSMAEVGGDRAGVERVGPGQAEPPSDLVIIEGLLPRLPRRRLEDVLHHLTARSERVIVFPGPLAATPPDHPPALPPELLAEEFAQLGFFRDPAFSADLTGGRGVLFRKAWGPIAEVVGAYEWQLWRLGRESDSRREVAIEQERELLSQERGLEERGRMLTEQAAEIERLHTEIERLHTYVGVANELRTRLTEVSARLDDILGSRSWRLMRRMQVLRLRLIPRGSAREHVLFAIYGVGRAAQRLGRRLSRGRRRLHVGWRRRGGVGATLLAEVPEVTDTPPPGKRTEPVDIIICIHNALVDVERCLESVSRHTAPPHHIILVDDGSDTDTRRALAAFAAGQGATLLRNERAEGYTRAANRGLRHSTAELVVLLNSDTVVTPGWLDRLVACAASAPEVGLVGPLSNTASWQSVPEIAEGDDWAPNDLPAGVTVDAMGDWVATAAGRVYPRLPFLNGFCLVVKRRVLENVGYFDEVTFGEGYGEENDFCLRAAAAGWELAVADDVYVFHAASRSYSHERRRTLQDRAWRALLAKYGEDRILGEVARCRTDRILGGVRARCRRLAERAALVADGRSRWAGRRVLVLLPVAEAGGGAHVVIQEGEAMRRMGVDVRLLNLASNQVAFERNYPDNAIPVQYIDRPEEVTTVATASDAVVATRYDTVGWLGGLSRGAPGPVLAHYVQDFEPLFFPEGSAGYREALGSYTARPGLVRVTKTDWNQRIVKERTGADCVMVGPSVAIDVFRPRRRTGLAASPGRILVAAMIRPSSPRRGPALTMATLERVWRRHRDTVDVVLFGCALEELHSQGLAAAFRWRHAGVLTRRQMATLLSEVDVFVDASEYQAMGLTALEAMASGAAVVVPQTGGAASFSRHRENALIVDTRSVMACADAVEELVVDRDLRQRLQSQGLDDACRFHPEGPAFRLLEALLGGSRVGGPAAGPEGPATEGGAERVSRE